MHVLLRTGQTEGNDSQQAAREAATEDATGEYHVRDVTLPRLKARMY